MPAWQEQVKHTHMSWMSNCLFTAHFLKLIKAPKRESFPVIAFFLLVLHIICVEVFTGALWGHCQSLCEQQRVSGRECSISKSKGCKKYMIEPFARSFCSPVEPGPVYRHMKTSFVISSMCLADKTSNFFFFRPALASLVQIVGQVELEKFARCLFFATLTLFCLPIKRKVMFSLALKDEHDFLSPPTKISTRSSCCC